MKYIPVIGLEIHAELLTESKIFCSCPNLFGGEANERVCPVCMGFPGTLPSLNKKVVELAIKAGLVTDCKINKRSTFDRKNYFYPDLPKAYQITQARIPICENGHIKLGDTKYRIERIHIEEDAGKLIHDNKKGVSYPDYNRCGVPLIEIVTKPDFSDKEEVREFVEELLCRLKFAGVCDGKLEQGSLRVDVNISLKEEGSATLGTRAEIKNLNSYKFIGKAIDYEIKRQSDILDKGEKVKRETRRFLDNGTTVAIREKEEESDYRFFPEPDIPDIVVCDEELKSIEKSLPIMPRERIKRYETEFNISRESARLIARSKDISDFYDATTSLCDDYKGIASLLLGAVMREINDTKTQIAASKLTPMNLARVVEMVNEGKISKNSANEIIRDTFLSGKESERVAEEKQLIINTDYNAIREAVKSVLDREKENVKSYKEGNQKLFGYFIGEITKLMGKGINPVTVKDILKEELEK